MSLNIKILMSTVCLQTSTYSRCQCLIKLAYKKQQIKLRVQKL